MRLLQYYLITFIFALLFQTSVLGVTITNRPVADAEMRQRSPDINLGTGTDIVAGELGAAAGFEIRRGLFRFDLSGRIPAGAVINSVTLRIVAVFKIPQGA